MDSFLIFFFLSPRFFFLVFNLTFSPTDLAKPCDDIDDVNDDDTAGAQDKTLVTTVSDVSGVVVTNDRFVAWLAGNVAVLEVSDNRSGNIKNVYIPIGYTKIFHAVKHGDVIVLLEEIKIDGKSLRVIKKYIFAGNINSNEKIEGVL